MLMPRLTQDCINAASGKFPGVEPMSKRKDRPVTIAVFENRFLEKYLARAHWITPGIWFGPIVTYGIYRAFTSTAYGPGRGALVLLAGLLAWTLVEYLLHRYFFHALKYDATKPHNYLAHGYHHDFPDDRYRLVMVPLGSWPLAVLWGGAYYLAFGAEYAFPLLSGTAGGYIAYDWIHYYTHHGRPKGGLGKWLRRYHMMHHFQDGDTRYGVSSPLWDFVFGTYKSAKTATQAQAHARAVAAAHDEAA